jgi:hypothetical protein
MNVLFLHIPKNAGSAIRHAMIDNPNINYHPWMNNHHFLSTLVNRCEYHNYKPDFSFCVARNPYDRVESIFSYSRIIYKDLYNVSSYKKQKSDYQDYVAYMNLNFKMWLKYVLFVRTKQSTDSINRTQSMFIDCDYPIEIFKYENLEPLEKRLGVELKIVNSHPKEKVEWDDESREMVRLYFKDDFKNFGYSLE